MRKFSVSNDNCRLDVKIYGVWTKFSYRVAQAGDPKVKVKLTNLHKPRRNRCFPKNLDGTGDKSVSVEQFQYKFYNKNYETIEYSSIEYVLAQAIAKFRNEYSLKSREER